MTEKIIIRIGDSTAGGRKPAHRRGEGSLGAGPKEVVVYHWGRIFLALGVALLLVGLGLWFVVENRSSVVLPIAQTPPVAIPLEVPKPPEVQGGAETGDSELSKLPTTPAEVIPRQVPSSDAEPAPAPRSNPVPDVPSKPELKADNVGSSPNAPANVDKAAPVAVPAPVRIHSPQIARAQLTSHLKDKLPTDRLASVVHLRGRSLIKVYFYTELKGLKGRRVYHRWYHDGKGVARVAIRPYRDDMNASSSKYISARMTGRWRVVVVDDQGRSLADAAFEVR
ncbi:DUF2914 domain-containing protein [Mangrovitalea sediminis]|uniref:DUF2914 domain-containing protein n=1 Tax=Mangrovitalea sediminis TaxID=1982043 RepID=UPI000BE59D7F|nr:DUF2914 domain-containing protein [Mangrovitalea sediminis]